MKAVILVGGKGTRLMPLTKNIPKPLIKIDGKSVLEHQIGILKLYEITDIILCCNYLWEKIKDYFGDGSKWNVKINYEIEEKPLGTAGAIKRIEKKLSEDFIVVYGDILFNINLDKFIDNYKNKKADVSLILHESDHPFDSDLVEIDKGSRINRIFRALEGENFVNLTNAGFYIMNKKILKEIPKDKLCDFGKEIFPNALKKYNLNGYVSKEYIKDMGTFERYKEVEKDLKDGKIFRKAFLLDRDGVINKDVNLLYKKEQLELIKGSAEAIKVLNEKGFLVIIVTNQSVVARELCREEKLEGIHTCLKAMLKEKGARIDGIYYCPHHPETHHPEANNPKYRRECKCRKPKPGMILQAAKDFRLDLSECYMVGNEESDIMAGKSAGTKTVLVNNHINVEADLVAENLYEAIEKLGFFR